MSDILYKFSMQVLYTSRTIKLMVTTENHNLKIYRTMCSVVKLSIHGRHP